MKPQEVANKILYYKEMFVMNTNNLLIRFEEKEVNMIIGQDGERFINLREYLVNYGLEDSGLTATKEDKQAIAIGKCPPQLLSDGTHYTEKIKEIGII